MLRRAKKADETIMFCRDFAFRNLSAEDTPREAWEPITQVVSAGWRGKMGLPEKFLT